MNLERPYTGKTTLVKPSTPVSLPVLNLDKMSDPSSYIPDDGLVDAVNVALMLRQPLLLTGEPGTGKTQLAFHIAWELGLDEPLIFETKSTSVSRDLFYSFDHLRRFQAAQSSGTSIDPREYVQYNALGLAILRTLPKDDRKELVPEYVEQDAPARSVVLIDEIDKAPRDFPNDILNEIDNLYFRIPELGGKMVRADDALRPIVIMTSNSEKSLPDPFLRRSIFYHIPFPDEITLEEILLARVAGIKEEKGGILNGILAFFDRLREDSLGLRKKPGTAELLNWSSALVGIGVDPQQSLKSQSEIAIRTLSALAKHQEDTTQVVSLFKAWVHE